MAVDWTDDVFGETHDGLTDLQNMEDNFQAIKSLFASSSEPSFTKVSGMPWYDTTQKILKIRNSVNNDWVGVMAGNENFIIWVYLNAITLQEGWDIDSSKQDMVLGLKGSTRYTTGGQSAGSWDQSTGLTKDPHTHTAGALLGPNHRHTIGGENSYIGGWPDQTTGEDGYTGYDGTQSVTGITGPQSDNVITSDLSWSIEAAVGIMVFPDVSP